MSTPAPALAQGQGTVAPPGNSGVSQYVEDVPTVKGNKPSSSVVVPTHGGGSGPGSPSGSSAGAGNALPTTVAEQLDHHGAAGKSTAALAQATAPPVSKRRPSNSKPPAAPSTAVLKALTGSTGGGGMGAFLPVFLIGTLIIVSAIGILHRRRST